MPFSFAKSTRRVKIGTVLLVFALAVLSIVIAIYLVQMKEGYAANLRSRQLLQKAQNVVMPGRVLQDAEGFTIIARLDIPSIGVSLPVIGELTKKGLSYSVCRLSGPQVPGQAGHLVIMGHSFRDGSHFGLLDTLHNGDAVQLMDAYGNVYYYEVFEIVSAKADDESALKVYYGERGLSLITTADSTNRSVLVRCREIVAQ